MGPPTSPPRRGTQSPATVPRAGIAPAERRPFLSMSVWGGRGSPTPPPAARAPAPPLGHVDVNGKLGLESDGRLAVEAFDAQTDVAAAKLTGAFTPPTRDGDGKLILDLPDLARFSTLAGVVLGGRAHLELSARARNRDLSADWQGTLDDLSLPGMPPGLAGQAGPLSGGAGPRRHQAWPPPAPPHA